MESHSFLSLPADTTMASSQGIQTSKMKREATIALIEAYRSLPELWDTESRHYSNRVKKAAAYDTTVTRTETNKELTKKTDKPDGKPVLCQRTYSSVFLSVFYKVKLHSLTSGVWSPLGLAVLGSQTVFESTLQKTGST